jgi:F-type H+-transporting ATPase subunit c
MRKVLALVAALAVVACAAGTVKADTTPAVVPAGTVAVAPAAAAAAPVKMAPLGMGLTVVGIGIGLGLIGFGAMGGIARQPEQAGNIRTTMLIIGGLVEGAGIIALVLCFVV